MEVVMGDSMSRLIYTTWKVSLQIYFGAALSSLSGHQHLQDLSHGLTMVKFPWAQGRGGFADRLNSWCPKRGVSGEMRSQPAGGGYSSPQVISRRT